jgi:hypothetical protein
LSWAEAFQIAKISRAAVRIEFMPGILSKAGLAGWTHEKRKSVAASRAPPGIQRTVK